MDRKVGYSQIPHVIDIALPSHAKVPKVDGVPLRVFWYPEPSFRAGVEVVAIDDVSVRIYSVEETIADNRRLLQISEQDRTGRCDRGSADIPRTHTEAEPGETDEIRGNQSGPEDHAPVP